MAEGVLGGLLGGEDEAADSNMAGETRAGAEAFAAAMAADHAKHDAAVARAAERFLDKQAQLLGGQIAELAEQRAWRLRHLVSQSREGKLRRIGQRIRIGSQAVFGLIAAGIGLGLLLMVLDAFSSKSVIVEPFDAPPGLATRGLTGKVIAGGVLDALSRIQAAVRTTATERRISNAWTNDIKVEVPETGVSLGDIDRMLKARFGHDIHIDGDLVQTDSGGLALTIRGDGMLPKTFEGGVDNLGKLSNQAAEYVYGQSQPALYANYLMSEGRNAEAVAIARASYATIDAADRPVLLNTWADALQNLGAPVQQSLQLYQEAVRLKPDFWVAYNNITNVDILRGDEEGAWRLGEAMRKQAGGRPGRSPELYYENVDLLTWNLLPWRAETLADVKAHGGVGTGVNAETPVIADIDQRLHDPADAELQLQTALSDGSDPSVAAVTHFVHGRMAAAAGDTARAAAEMEAFQAAYANPIVSTNYPGYPCWIAPAEEAAGHPDKADAALKAGGRYVDCYRFRGDILDHRGDWPGAQRAYAQAVAIAPDLPAGYYSWGEALARHGDLTGAVIKLEAANRRGPNWADPLKAWGDVLARQGRWKEALGRYDEALKHAPAWAGLRQAREEAARRAG